jgi:hypothetical protein
VIQDLAVNFADYWEKFDSLYHSTVHAALGAGNPALAELTASSLYFPELLAAAALSGSEIGASPGEAVGLMVQLEAYVFKQKYGVIRCLVSSSLRFRMGGHRKMIAAVRPRVDHLRTQQIIDNFVQRMTNNLKTQRME